MFLIDKTVNKATEVEKKTFHELKFDERHHLQEWIATNSDILGEQLLIIQKEFSDWSDTNERLDLLALDERGNLVIIENKLDDSGKDVVWQALKYVSYCAALSKSEICEIFQRYLDVGAGGKASEKITEFYDAQSYDEIVLNSTDNDQRVILVAANFRKEVTSTVLWLIDHDVDITCVRVTPYQTGDQIYLDSERIIPLQGVGDYQIRLREKRQETIARKFEDTVRAALNYEFWEAALPKLRERSDMFKSISPGKNHWVTGASGHGGVHYDVCIFKNGSRAELYIDTPDKEKNKKLFCMLYGRRAEFEKAFGAELDWRELPDKRASKISFASEEGGIDDQDNWDRPIEFLSDAAARMRKTFQHALDEALR